MRGPAYGDGNKRRQFRVTERRAGAEDSAEQKRKDHAGSGQARTDSREGINTRPHDRTDAERDEMRPAQAWFEPRRYRRRSFSRSSARNAAQRLPLQTSMTIGGVGR